MLSTTYGLLMSRNVILLSASLVKSSGTIRTKSTACITAPELKHWFLLNPLMGTDNYNAISNDLKLVH